MKHVADLIAVAGNGPDQLLAGRKLLAQLGGSGQLRLLARLASGRRYRIQRFRLQWHVHVSVSVPCIRIKKAPAGLPVGAFLSPVAAWVACRAAFLVMFGR